MSINETELAATQVIAIEELRNADRLAGKQFSTAAENLRMKYLDQKFSRLTKDERAEYWTWEERIDVEYGPIKYFWDHALGLSWSECKSKFESESK